MVNGSALTSGTRESESFPFFYVKMFGSLKPFTYLYTIKIQIMEITGQIIQVIRNVTLDIHPIGNVVWSFDKPTRKLKDQHRINIGDVKIIYSSEITITESVEQFILAMGKSDLYTDGKKFYTTFGTCIKEIQHPLFEKFLKENQ